MFLRKLKYRSLLALRRERLRLRELSRWHTKEADDLRREREALALAKLKVDQELQKAQALSFKAQSNLARMEEKISAVITAASQLGAIDGRAEIVTHAVIKMRERNHHNLLQ